ncbi:DEKNAAC100443 [Brettanomyces naardenensis]|uniref:DEKNAAC100443 n=1 Tax=Brettanomyces naardenensis TaxID=13370 RepID=A0A448YEM4_BRENA|nr:DEKNAAC100443 [Brettanomyces naardenensis]
MSSSELEYLYSIRSVRDTNQCTDGLIEENRLTNFDVDSSKFDSVVDFVISTIESSYETKESLLTIPIHGRYQHFEGNGKPRLTNLINDQLKGETDLEICKKLVDLFMVSVLLDAGAGNEWKYTEDDGTVVSRSEGLAVASFHMFSNGDFSDSKKDKYQVNGSKLANFSEEEMKKGFQVTSSNPIAGFEGRYQMIRHLGQTLVENKEVFGEDARPGNMVDYLIANKAKGRQLDLEDLWMCLIKSLQPIWPTEGRIKVSGETIGDVWFLQNRIDYSKKKFGKDDVPEWSKVVTFHKLVQWLTYSLFLPLIKYGHFEILNANYMTGLPEYRNGGLFVDLGLLTLKPDQLARGLEFSKKVGFNPEIPTFTPEDDVIVEWRSCIICLLDRLLPLVNGKMGISGTKYEMSLPQLIEAGSWSSGRAIAKKLRSNGGPPIELFADGTVF